MTREKMGRIPGYAVLENNLKTFRGTTKCENKKLRLIFSLLPGSGREG